ncbi:MAG: hypothetical protein V2A66_05525 [Pseudomonadota bacterium]
MKTFTRIVISLLLSIPLFFVIGHEAWAAVSTSGCTQGATRAIVPCYNSPADKNMMSPCSGVLPQICDNNEWINNGPCDHSASDRISCGNGYACETGICDAGTCYTKPVSCDDGNRCTTDSCAPNSSTFTGAPPYVCNHNPVIGGTSCTPTDNLCATAGQCQGGACVTTQTKLCLPKDLCSTASCNKSTGECTNTPKLMLCSNPPGQCYNATGSCDQTIGSCAYTPLPGSDGTPNICGTCTTLNTNGLTPRKEADCGACGKVACNSTNDSLVCNDPGANACGGCSTLIGTYGGSCGQCGRLACGSDKHSLVCNDPGANACGGCSTLSGTCGASCGQCGRLVCGSDKNSLVCNDPGANVCGGCSTLIGTYGGSCGQCGHLTCSSDKNSLICNDPGANACGGCGTLPGIPGQPCPAATVIANPCTTNTWRCSTDGSLQCVSALQANGTTCNDNNPCTTGETCRNGTCTGTPVTCPDDEHPCTQPGRCVASAPTTTSSEYTPYTCIYDPVPGSDGSINICNSCAHLKNTSGLPLQIDATCGACGKVACNATGDDLVCNFSSDRCACDPNNTPATPFTSESGCKGTITCGADGNLKTTFNTASAPNDGKPCDGMVSCDATTGALVRGAPITKPANDDACCPPGANAATDNDCSPSCGNGVMEKGEKCDKAIAHGQSGACPTKEDCNSNEPCITDTLAASAENCTAECKHERTGCNLDGRCVAFDQSPATCQICKKVADDTGKVIGGVIAKMEAGAPCNSIDPCHPFGFCQEFGTCLGTSEGSCACNPNETRPCPGDDICGGTQTCNEKGRWDACKYPQAGVECKGDQCYTKSICSSAGKCLADTSTKKSCDDGNDCTDDTCDSASGKCVHTINTAPCTGLACMKDNVCKDGKCSGTPNCLDDACHKGGACEDNGKCKFATEITACVNVDGCCPAGCTPANDSDCSVAPTIPAALPEAQTPPTATTPLAEAVQKTEFVPLKPIVQSYCDGCSDAIAAKNKTVHDKLGIDPIAECGTSRMIYVVAFPTGNAANAADAGKAANLASTKPGWILLQENGRILKNDRDSTWTGISKPTVLLHNLNSAHGASGKSMPLTGLPDGQVQGDPAGRLTLNGVVTHDFTTMPIETKSLSVQLAGKNADIALMSALSEGQTAQQTSWHIHMVSIVFPCAQTTGDEKSAHSTENRTYDTDGLASMILAVADPSKSADEMNTQIDTETKTKKIWEPIDSYKFTIAEEGATAVTGENKAMGENKYATVTLRTFSKPSGSFAQGSAGKGCSLVMDSH